MREGGGRRCRRWSGGTGIGRAGEGGAGGCRRVESVPQKFDKSCSACRNTSQKRGPECSVLRIARSIVACDLCVVEVSVLIRACQVTCRRGDPVADTLYHQRGQRVHRYANTICNCDYEDARNEGRQGYTTWALVADSYGSALRYRRANRLDCPVVVLYLAHCINSIYFTASFISQLYLRRNLIEIGFRISTIIISPTPLLAATFMIFSRVVQQLGTGYSWLSP
jgi:hypothetical protein